MNGDIVTFLFSAQRTGLDNAPIYRVELRGSHGCFCDVLPTNNGNGYDVAHKIAAMARQKAFPVHVVEIGTMSPYDLRNRGRLCAEICTAWRMHTDKLKELR